MDAAGSAIPSPRSSSLSSSSSLVRQSTDLVGENYVQNCRFSPDGLCILTNSVLDNRLRLYNTHGPTTAKTMKMTGPVRLPPARRGRHPIST
jgi:WD40 repeat protein